MSALISIVAIFPSLAVVYIGLLAIYALMPDGFVAAWSAIVNYGIGVVYYFDWFLPVGLILTLFFAWLFIQLFVWIFVQVRRLLLMVAQLPPTPEDSTTYVETQTTFKTGQRNVKQRQVTRDRVRSGKTESFGSKVKRKYGL